MSRSIPDPGFAGDDGSAPSALREALAVYREDPDGGYLPALAALSGSRVLVLVVALGEESAGVEMAVVLTQRPDGAKAMLAFTGTAQMTTWNPEARPVPVPAATAARSGVQDGAVALLLDAAGPVRFVVQGESLALLAQGHRLVALDDGGWGWVAG